MPQPQFALLLDVDGPITNRDSKRIVEPSIGPALLALPALGVPVVLNTGRSFEFVEDQVLRPMATAGSLPDSGFHVVCEKGAAWFSVRNGKAGDRQLDGTIAVPGDLKTAIINLVATKYDETMFFDYTKRAMITVERRLDVSHEVFQIAQAQLVRDLSELTKHLGYRVAVDTGSPEASGAWRIDATTIATDVESQKLGKDLGAQRALELLAADNVHPAEWRTVGDSASDYAMADFLNAQGIPVRHVDVNPSTPLQSRSYPVLRPRHSSFDAAGAAYLDWAMASARGTAISERNFDGSPDARPSASYLFS